jgi:hypothetical protein
MMGYQSFTCGRRKDCSEAKLSVGPVIRGYDQHSLRLCGANLDSTFYNSCSVAAPGKFGMRWESGLDR